MTYKEAVIDEIKKIVKEKMVECPEGDEERRLYNTIQSYAWAFSGPRNRDRRQDVVFELTGERLPKAKCGVNYIKKIVNDIFEKGEKR